MSHATCTASTSITMSRSLVRAAISDRKRIAAAKADLEDRRARTLAELRDLDARILALAERAELLDRLIGPAIEQSGEAAETLGEVLRGAAIRRVAVAQLYAEHGAGHPVHYRAWLASLQQRGYVVLGNVPAATFLSNIQRSPLLIRGAEPGTYLIDERIAARLREQLAEQQAELRDLDGVIAAHDGVAPAQLREQRTRLTFAVRRLERQVAESDAILEPATNGALASAVR
jgi:predicted nuclease with TOPRIM domain